MPDPQHNDPQTLDQQTLDQQTLDQQTLHQQTLHPKGFTNRIKQLLARGQTAWGAALPDASETMAAASANTGIDFLWIDIEHRPYDVYEVRWAPIICRMRCCEPMVRVAGLDSSSIKKALDIGASTIMVPQVNSADEARLAVHYAKYPPQGARGVSPWWAALLNVPWDQYLPAANQETCVVVQIETPEGLDNVEEIAAVDGVDVCFAGPADIAASLGCIGRIDDARVQQCLAAFPRRVAASGKASGITFLDFEQCRRAHEQGYRFISFGTIMHKGAAGLSDELARLRKLDA